MRTGPDIDTSKLQKERIHWLREHVCDDTPAAELKDFRVSQPDVTAPGKLGRMIIVEAEIGYPDDEHDHRRALRCRRVFLISPRGRHEEWRPRRAFA